MAVSLSTIDPQKLSFCDGNLPYDPAWVMDGDEIDPELFPEEVLPNVISTLETVLAACKSALGLPTEETYNSYKAAMEHAEELEFTEATASLAKSVSINNVQVIGEADSVPPLDPGTGFLDPGTNVSV